MNRQWERIKADERAAEAARSDAGRATAASATKSALDGISPSLPALAASQEMQERAANLGYDWPSIDGVLDKVAEEADELRRAAETDAERGRGVRRPAVRARQRRPPAAGSRPRRRCAPPTTSSGGGSASVERAAAARGVALRDLDFEALDALWDAAKAEEKTT